MDDDRIIPQRVRDDTPRLTDQQRFNNVRAGLCGCGCPSKRSGWAGGWTWRISELFWRRCVWSTGVEFRIRYGEIEYRYRSMPNLSWARWNMAKEASGLLDDRQVHALICFLTNPRGTTKGRSILAAVDTTKCSLA